MFPKILYHFVVLKNLHWDSRKQKDLLICIWQIGRAINNFELELWKSSPRSYVRHVFVFYYNLSSGCYGYDINWIWIQSAMERSNFHRFSFLWDSWKLQVYLPTDLGEKRNAYSWDDSTSERLRQLYSMLQLLRQRYEYAYKVKGQNAAFFSLPKSNPTTSATWTCMTSPGLQQKL